jgi:hypothetical protein
VEDQERFVLPADWRTEELQESKEVFVIKGKGYLKIVPKKIDLTEFFDRADLGMNIEEWDEFERRFYTSGGLSGRNRARAGIEDGPE